MATARATTAVPAAGILAGRILAAAAEAKVSNWLCICGAA